MRLSLIPDWHQAWRWSSMRFLAIGGAIQLGLVSAPTRITDHVPDWLMAGLASFSLICIMLAGIGRVTVVEKPNEPPKPDN